MNPWTLSWQSAVTKYQVLSKLNVCIKIATNIINLKKSENSLYYNTKMESQISINIKQNTRQRYPNSETQHATLVGIENIRLLFIRGCTHIIRE